MLELVHRTVLGQAPEHFKQRFCLEHAMKRSTSRFHLENFRLHEYINRRQLAVVKRSALGLISIYNMLPTEIVEAKTVKCFQGLRQDLAKDCGSKSHPHWDSIFATRHRLHVHTAQSFNVLKLYNISSRCIFVYHSGLCCTALRHHDAVVVMSSRLWFLVCAVS